MNIASFCRTAIVSAVFFLCLGCATGPNPAGRDASMVQASDQALPGAQAAASGGSTLQRPMIDRMDRTTVKKALAYERQGETSVVQQTAGASSGSSVMQSISSSFQHGVDKVGSLFTPPPPAPKRDTDPTSLSSKATPSPELYTAMARLSERQGNFQEAERQYQQALKLSPKQLEALVGLGRLQDRQGRMDEAVQNYHKAVKAHPSEATVYNDLGLCYERRRMYPESIDALKRAVQLQPTQPLYRNNLAAVLVETGDNDSAFTQLAAVHGEAGACYNLGYLLYKKGQYELAIKLFAKAMEKDRSLVQVAGPWLQQAQNALVAHSASGRNPSIATSGLPLPSEQPGEASIGRPAGVVASPGGAMGASPAFLEARRTTIPGRPTRQLPPVTSDAKPGEPETAPLPPTLSYEGLPQGGMSPQTAPLPPIQR